MIYEKYGHKAQGEFACIPKSCVPQP